MDSDEELDRRRSRDRFHRERNDFDTRGQGVSGGFVRRDMPTRGGNNSAGNRYGGGSYSRDRGPFSGEPPIKRPRPYDSTDNRPHRNSGPRDNTSPNRGGVNNYEGGVTQPPMMTLKEFILNQDDQINDEEAVQKYKEYKEAFAKRQLEEFFQAHKAEPWFIEKYHPDYYSKRLDGQEENIRKRLEVFMKFYDKGIVDGCRVHIDNSDELIKLMDSIVIMLEGGTDDDLRILDGDSTSEVGKISPQKDSKPSSRRKEDKKSSDHASKSEAEKSDGEESSSEENSSVSSAARSSSHLSSPKAVDSTVNANDDSPLEPPSNGQNETEVNLSKGDVEDGRPAPRPLHKTQSIFLRTLAPQISRQEIEEICRSFNGFKRLALHDPQPERQFTRRGWATYSPDCSESIKDICWKLNETKVKNTDLHAMVNRELAQRVRPIMVLANHPTQMRQDAKNVAKLVQKLDARHKLWNYGLDNVDGKVTGVTLPPETGNPLMSNITDYLVEEGNYEEEALLGKSGGGDDGEIMDSGNTGRREISLDEDFELSRVLDRLILYLRVVHSVDYYSATEYPEEDEMPHKCGIIHARGAHIEPDRPLLQNDLDNYMKGFEVKVNRLLASIDPLCEIDCKKLGLRNPEVNAEAYIKANIQELGPEKWLCPISGKKFKGPDFVRKHILNKHMEKVDIVKNEAIFYNNYILDPRRPQLPPHPVTKAMYTRSNVPSQSFSREQSYNRTSFSPTRVTSDSGYSGHRDKMSGGNQFRRSPYQSGGYRDMGDRNRQYNYREDSGGRGGNSFFNRQGGQNSNFGGGRYYNNNNNSNQQRPREFGRGRYAGRDMISYQDLDAPNPDE